MLIVKLASMIKKMEWLYVKPALHSQTTQRSPCTISKQCCVFQYPYPARTSSLRGWYIMTNRACTTTAMQVLAVETTNILCTWTIPQLRLKVEGTDKIMASTNTTAGGTPNRRNQDSLEDNHLNAHGMVL